MMDPDDYQKASNENQFIYNEDDQDPSVEDYDQDLDDLGHETKKYAGEETTQMPEDESVLFDRLQESRSE